MTRQVLSLTFLLLMLAPQQPSAARDRAVYGIATLTTCHVWTDYFDPESGSGVDDLYMKFALRSWVHGFVTGASAAQGVDGEFGRVAESEIVPWITNYCRQNPMHVLDAAASEFLTSVLSLKK
ncbi:MAG TPA: hypothetical protein VH702_01865 [Vicinamibacterales bacterium]|jgi:hypothetical protein